MMANGADGSGRVRNLVAHGLFLLMPFLLLWVPCVRGQEVDPWRFAEEDMDGPELTWWAATLEWGAGTAVGTGVGVLKDHVGNLQIPLTHTGLDALIGSVNLVTLIAVSTPFACAAGCDAVGLAVGQERVLWFGFAVGGIAEVAAEPLGEYTYARTGNTVLRRLVPAAVGSVGAVLGYNGLVWLQGWRWPSMSLSVGNSEVTNEALSTGDMSERRSTRWRTMPIEAACGTALGAAGGLILPRWLHHKADSLGQKSSDDRTADRLMDIGVIYPVACMIGIDASALIMHRQNEFWIGYLGAALGTAAVVGVGALTGFSKQLDDNPFARLIPAVAAGVVGTIGYNYTDFDDELSDGRQRFAGPALAYIGPDCAGGGTGVNFNLRLLTVRF